MSSSRKLLLLLLILCLVSPSFTSTSDEDKIFIAKKALRWILGSDISIDTFFKDYWAKKELYVQRGDERYFQELFQADNFTAAIRQMHAINPEEVGMGTYSKGFNNTAQEYDTMCGAFMDGGGIVINAFNRAWAPLSRLCSKLQAIFYTAVMNLYLTPKKAQTFTAHTDPQDVFILQVSGYKRWRVYDTPVEAPFEAKRSPESLRSL